jgi:oligopeptide/dipeptide ABC transporter ATP-binding protein
MVFQEPSTAFNPVISVGKQIVEAIQAHKKINTRTAKDAAMGLLSKMGIGSPTTVFDSYPNQLSGGMRQRALIAMALSCSPEVLIADEPTTALDVTVQAQVLDLLRELRDDSRMAQVVISHDLGVVAEIADQIAVMYCGRIVEFASSKQLFTAPSHPYTRALLACLPQRATHVAGARLPSIRGRVPSLLERPAGCPFQNRCDLMTKECEEQLPELSQIEGSHLVRCFHAGSKQ